MNEANEIQDSPEDSAQNRSTDHAANLLRWLELQGLILDYGRLRKAHQPDAWWIVMQEEEEVTGPYEFRAVLTALVDGAVRIQVVHDAQAASEEPAWTTLQYRPLWQNPQMLRLWRGALWTLAALFTYMLVSSVTPLPLRPAVNLAFPLILAGWLGRRFLLPLWRRVQSSVASSVPSRRSVKTGVAVAISTAVIALMAWLPKETYESLLTRGEAAWAQIVSRFPGNEKPKPTRQTVQAAARPETLTPVEAPPPAAPAAEMEPAAPEPEAFNLAALGETPALWPKTVALRQKTSFPAVLDGREIGRVDVPSGTQVRVATIREGQLTLEYQGGTQAVPPDATDLEDRVRSIRSALKAPPRPLAPVSAPPQPSATTAMIAFGKPADAPEEVPGIPAQPANYFGTRPQPR